MDDYNDVLISAAEFIKDRLYFVTLKTKEQPKSTACTHYFSIEDQLLYESFFSDFGPLNISMLYHYCMKLNRKLSSGALENKRIVHTSTGDKKKRVNAACLIASYSIIYLQYSPQKAYDILNFNNKMPYIHFRDASVGEPYTISLMDCLNGIHKAFNLGYFDFTSFDHAQYEYYERVENGDLNWIVPGKFLGFCGPHNKSRNIRGYPLHSPEFYFKYFRQNNVTTIIRLNKKMYDSNKFTNAGFNHYDLYFVDGSTPTDKILNDFLNICEKTVGGIAVHCKAGLGRTGTLIGCYLMKHYRFSACEAIAWIRMCRPGSVIGHQQEWLENKEALMLRDGDTYRKKKGSVPIKHKFGIYGKNTYEVFENESTKDVKINDKVTGILKKVDTLKLNDNEEKEEEGAITQGDKLNQIKARRQCQSLPNTFSERRVFKSRVLVNTLETPTIIRGGKVLSAGIKSPTSSNSRVLSKRNETNEAQVGLTPRRTSQRKPAPKATTLTTVQNGKCKTQPRKMDNCWIVEDNSGLQNGDSCNSEKKETKCVKRGKRALALEKDKASPRSVKVLRRSHTQSSADADAKPRSKLHLPIVKSSK